MKSSAVRARLQAQSGFSLVELVITMAVMGVVLGGLANIFVSGERTSADATARMTSQQGVRVAFDRLEYDARCASSATLLNKSGSNGAGVYLVLPSQCDHATGTVTWCVNSGSLQRSTGTTCADTTHRITYVASVTSTTPFSCYAPSSGVYPQLQVALTVNPTTRNAEKTSATDYITMHNVLGTYHDNSGNGPTTLPATTITVGSTAGFPAASTLNTPSGVLTYTGTTATTFTGVTGGTGSFADLAPVVWAGGCS